MMKGAAGLRHEPGRTQETGALPARLRHYLVHVIGGVPIRRIAAREGIAPSTVLRHVRAIEQRRDDAVFDRALSRLEEGAARSGDEGEEGGKKMGKHMRQGETEAMTARFNRTLMRLLGRLEERGAYLAVMPGAGRGAVFRNTATGEPVRLAGADDAEIHALVLRDWLTLEKRGKVHVYRLSRAGRAALARMRTADRRGVGEETPDPFAAQHFVPGERVIADGAGAARRMRCNMAESPLHLLARRRDRRGRPFLTTSQVQAGERLREDFELGQMAPRVTQNWERFLTGGTSASAPAGRENLPRGPQAARERFAKAVAAMGPGLADIAVRCCCFLEGLEQAERRLGWSARSGKIVLRIALERLARHYDETCGPRGPLIG